MSEPMNKPYMSIEYVNEWGDRTSVEYENSGLADSEAAWVVENFRGFMLACGFGAGTVEDYLGKE